MTVHNHGPNRERGLDCPEHEIDGKLIGYCLILAAMALEETVDN